MFRERTLNLSDILLTLPSLVKEDVLFRLPRFEGRILILLPQTQPGALRQFLPILTIEDESFKLHWDYQSGRIADPLRDLAYEPPMRLILSTLHPNEVFHITTI